jgi:hypothetical protein
MSLIARYHADRVSFSACLRASVCVHLVGLMHLQWCACVLCMDVARATYVCALTFSPAPTHTGDGIPNMGSGQQPLGAARRWMGAQQHRGGQLGCHTGPHVVGKAGFVKRNGGGSVMWARVGSGRYRVWEHACILRVRLLAAGCWLLPTGCWGSRVAYVVRIDTSLRTDTQTSDNCRWPTTWEIRGEGSTTSK